MMLVISAPKVTVVRQVLTGGMRLNDVQLVRQYYSLYGIWGLLFALTADSANSKSAIIRQAYVGKLITFALSLQA